jgi:hypothetical protein
MALDLRGIAKIKAACRAIENAAWKGRKKGKHGGMTPARRVLEALLWRSRPGKGLALPYEAIAEAAHYCRRTIADALARLKRLGLITVHRRRCRTGTPMSCTRRVAGAKGRCSRGRDPSANPARLKSHCFFLRAKRSPERPLGASRTESIPVKR